MSQPARDAAPRSTFRIALAAVALAWDIGVTTTVFVDLILSGWNIPPSPLWSFAITVGAILTVSAVMVEVGTRAVESRHCDVDRIIARIDLLEERSARRYADLNGAQADSVDALLNGLGRPAAPSQRRLNSVDS